MTPERYEQVVAVFQAASDLEGAERAAYIDRACAGDEELRREVESLLAQDGGSRRGVLDRPAFSAPGLQKGARLGPYEIQEPLGSGGMGEVYRARDTRLNREVAVKISSERFSERFEREARAIAALNHSNICHLYDIGPNYLVMELVDGPTLAERLQQGAIPMEEALAITRQIADALDAAHEKGITHRDLKPANVKVRPDGMVKVLDFGLAKIGGTAAAASDDAPTMAMGETETGTILGTASYMSPEQAKGSHVDRRADIYAFGAILYEMLTGERLHRGKTKTEILASVMRDEPYWDRVPGQVQRLLRGCLEKDPQKRLRHIGDVMRLVEGAPAAVPPAITKPRVRRWVIAASASAGLLAAAGAVAIWYFKSPAPKPVTRLTLSLPPGQRLVTPVRPTLAISPDGTRLVYAASAGDVSQLYLRPMDGLEARAIPGTEGGVTPFFSPDGQWIGFSAGGKLKKVSLSGGPPINLADVVANGAMGASWSSQGVIAFSPGPRGAVQQVPDTGGTVEPLTRLENGEVAHLGPEFLPDGKGLLFQIPIPIVPTFDKAAVQLAGAGHRELPQIAGDLPRYAPSGHVVYLQGANLMAAPFDLRRLAVTGAAIPVIEGVRNVQYSFSLTGTLAYASDPTQTLPSKLVWVDRKGSEQPLPAAAHNYVMPRISPDGRRVAAGLEEAPRQGQVWLYDLSLDTLTPLTFGPGSNIDPVWTPDGKRIVFKGAGNALFWQPSDGSGAAEALTNGPLSLNDIPSSFSPDGQALAIVEPTLTSAHQGVWVLQLRDRKAQLFEQGQTDETAPRFSPEGRRIAYTSGESGRPEIYVRPYPGPGGKYQISTEGGVEPMWNPKGRELFYRTGSKMMAVDVTTQPGFSAGKPRALFEDAYVPTPRSSPDYDVSPDGQRFLMLKRTEDAQAATQMNVVLNWFEELKRRVPASTK